MTMVFPATISKISSGQLRGGLRALVLVATSKSFPVIGTVPCPSPSQTPSPEPDCCRTWREYSYSGFGGRPLTFPPACQADPPRGCPSGPSQYVVIVTGQTAARPLGHPGP